LVWFELLADPVRYLQREETALRKLGVCLKHEVKRFLPGSGYEEVQRYQVTHGTRPQPMMSTLKLRQMMLLFAYMWFWKSSKVAKLEGLGRGAKAFPTAATKQSCLSRKVGPTAR
jgi:hypothetical protein